jgi:peptidoglycan hydrolase-like protein with peptidoglycan-binding domain
MATRTKPKPKAATTAPTPAPAAESASATTSSGPTPSPGPWPAKGYDGPAPWELADQHLKEHDEHRALVGMKLDDNGQLTPGGGRQPEQYRGPGAVTHSMPMLTQGVADASYPTPVVSELVRRLKLLGYCENSIAKGTNAAGVFDASVWTDVVNFQRDHGIVENEQSFAGGTVPAQDLVDRHVGPYTWQALIELSDQAEHEREASWR